jgi:hypothetical protein
MGRAAAPPRTAQRGRGGRAFLAEPVITSFVDAHLDTLGLDRSHLAMRRRGCAREAGRRKAIAERT